MLNSPVSIEKLDRIIELVELGPKSQIVDIGCGEGDLLHHIINRFGTECHGIDPDLNALENCRAKGSSLKLKLHATTGEEFLWPEKPFELAICIGSSHAFGGYVPTLKKLKEHVLPGGFILMGDLYWRSMPILEQGQVLSEGWPSLDSSFQSFITAGEKEGLLSVYSVRSNEDEWDHFEGSFVMRKFRKALNESDVEKRKNDLQKIKDWRDDYLKWRASCIGFGLWLFQNIQS